LSDPYKIIIVDDEPLIREELADGIDWTAADAEVVGCYANGLEALNACLDYAPDVILTDICMPDLNGIELIGRLREMGGDAEIIIISGYRDFAYAQEAINLGVSAYITKPINEELLLRAFERAKNKCKINRQMSREIDPAEESYEKHDFVKSVREYVLEHYAEPDLTLKKIAETVLFLNVNYLGRRFSSESGERFSQFLIRVRMDKAKEMLPTYGIERVDEIANLVGCSSKKYFSQIFKRYTGVSPQRYLSMIKAG
jgi:two-component system response regulator YesN